MTSSMISPLEAHDALGDELGVRLLVKRDDLLPFPLAGNKVRKIIAELDSLEGPPELLISNGAIGSNHCRTLALVGAQRGIRVHLVLHGEVNNDAQVALRLLKDLHASFDVVDPGGISQAIRDAQASALSAGSTVHVIAGGCHTAAGAGAYRDAAADLLEECSPTAIVLASGTGATQGGIVAGVADHRLECEVIGISIARPAGRGADSVREAARWAGASDNVDIDFLDEYRDGGYGLHGPETDNAVKMGWAHGLPLDPVYTGKAFAGLLGLIAQGRFNRQSTVVFWHTGGLANYLFSNRKTA